MREWKNEQNVESSEEEEEKEEEEKVFEQIDE